jgi:enamine deaminase RidA (YjgF/YER057c/UK114 family)
MEKNRMSPLERETLNPSSVATPLGTYSNAVKVKAGSLLYIAGQVGVDPQGNLVGPGDVGAQTQQVFRNIGAILESAGASFSNVLEFTTYLVGRESVQPYMAARTAAFPTMFPAGDYPANTLLIISGLVREDLLVEIKAVAALP